MDLPTAIAMYTINAAYANQQERETGSIEVGKLADLVVLERNLFDVEPRKIRASIEACSKVCVPMARRTLSSAE